MYRGGKLRAIVLVGGEGTRLRPLTLCVPKAVVPVVNRPMMFLILNWLKSHGVSEVVLSACYKPDILRKVIGRTYRGMKIDYIYEESPLGTGGAVKRAEKYINGTTVVMNGDILTDLDLSKMLKFHRQKKSRVSIALTQASNPSSYGVVETGRDGSVLRFLEKPSPEEVAGKVLNINAGVYIIEPGTLDLMKDGKVYSIERDIFPKFIGDGFYGFVSRNIYWMDLGTAAKYVKACRDILEGAYKVKGLEAAGKNVKFGGGSRAVRPSCIGSGTVVGGNSRIGELSVLGKNCVIGKNCVVERAILWDNVTIGDNCVISDCVLAGGVKVGASSSVTGETVLGEGSVLAPYSRLRA